MPPSRWELEDDPWVRMRRNGDDWEHYSKHGTGIRYTVARYGSSEKAKRECEREMNNRNRRIKRIRKDHGL